MRASVSGALLLWDRSSGEGPKTTTISPHVQRSCRTKEASYTLGVRMIRPSRRLSWICLLILFDLSRQKGTLPTEEEREHLRQCGECERILEVFARQFTKLEKASEGKPEDAA